MMSLIESIKSFNYSYEELWYYYLEKIKEFDDVNRLDELIEVISSLRSNDIFHRYATWDKIGEDGTVFMFNINKVYFFRCAKKSLGYQHLIPIYIPEITHHLIDINTLISVYAIVQISFITHSGHYLELEEDKLIKLSDIGAYITFFVEDFYHVENILPNYDETFFKKLHNAFWDNGRVSKFDTLIHRLISTIYGNYGLDFVYCRGFHMAMFYLMGCNALKEGRDSINCDDVVIAYLTGFKIILNDIRPLVYELYDEEKWKDESSWK